MLALQELRFENNLSVSLSLLLFIVNLNSIRDFFSSSFLFSLFVSNTRRISIIIFQDLWHLLGFDGTSTAIQLSKNYVFLYADNGNEWRVRGFRFNLG